MDTKLVLEDPIVLEDDDAELWRTGQKVWIVPLNGQPAYERLWIETPRKTVPIAPTAP